MTGEWVREILARWGETVTVCRHGEEPCSVQAFLQPVSRQGDVVPDGMTAAGWTDGRLWLYLGLSEVHGGDCIVWRGKSFRVRSGRGYYTRGKLCHWQASLERERVSL